MDFHHARAEAAANRNPVKAILDLRSLLGQEMRIGVFSHRRLLSAGDEALV